MLAPKPDLPISALIARVSLEKQAQNGYSLETQIRMMSEINAREGYATSEEYVLQDDGYEGDDWDRPAINKGLELIRTGKVRALTFMETDRFSRDVHGGLALIEKVRTLGGDVILGDLGRVRDEGHFLLMLHIKLAIAQFQKASIKAKSRSAIVTKIERGEIHGGRAPYGYTYLDKKHGSKLVVNPEQAANVRKIFRWYDQGWSLRRIVRQLIADGVPAPGRPRKDGSLPSWSITTISDMFGNETYIGAWHYNKYRHVEPLTHRSTKPRHRKRVTRKLRDREEWLKVDVEPLVDRALFERCKKRASANVHTRSGRPSDRYLLRGLIWCGACGHRMCGQRRRKPYRDLSAPAGPDGYHPIVCTGDYQTRYDCSNFSKITSERFCNARVKAVPLEELVWAETIAVLTDEALLRRLLAEHDKKNGATKRGEREHLERRIAELFQAEMRYRADSGRVTGSKARETRQHYARLIEEAQAQREALERDLAKKSPVGARVDVSALVAAARAGAKNANRTERQELLVRWVSRVEYHNGEVKIELLIPLCGATGQNCSDDQHHTNSFAPIVLIRRVA